MTSPGKMTAGAVNPKHYEIDTVALGDVENLLPVRPAFHNANGIAPQVGSEGHQLPQRLPHGLHAEVCIFKAIQQDQLRPMLA